MSEASNGARRPPTTARGLRTRAKVVAAARRVLERDGYLGARLVDMTAEAGVAAGTFYTYFSNKEEVFEAILADLQQEMIHPAPGATDSDDPVAIIRAGNSAYLAMYKRNARLMGLFEQVAAIDERFRALRDQRGKAFMKRNARSIQILQIRGLADPRLDASLAAAALGAMVSRMAYKAYVLEERWDDDDLVEDLTRLWANAIGVSSNAT